MTDQPTTTRPAAPTIVGLDLSLTSTGIARIRPGHPTEVATLRPGSRTGHPRLAWLRTQIRDCTGDATIAVLEGPSFGSAGGLQHERAGLWWMIAHHLYARGIPYFAVTPSQLKKYAAGKGNASKDQVLAAVIRRYGHIPVADNNQADALVLAAMAADYYSCPIATVPAAHRTVLRTVRNWPAIGDHHA